MTHHFIEDKYKRIEKKEKEHKKKQPTRNQPKVKIWTPTLFDPKPTDKISYFIVSLDEPRYLKEIEKIMGKVLDEL